jgi:hypothetical protein
MGFSIKDITYKRKPILTLTEQEFAGPWVSFKLEGEPLGSIPVLLKNIEPTPIFQLVNSRTGLAINRITLDFNLKEYLKKQMRFQKINTNITLGEESLRIRKYTDIFIYPKIPFSITFFTYKNLTNFNLKDFSVYFIFDLDINGLEGFDDDYSGYDSEHDIIYQYDKTGLHAGFSTISKPTHYESGLTREFIIDNEKLNLSDNLYDGAGEILSALQIAFKTLGPGQSFQTALIISGGFTKEEMIENIVKGKQKAMKYLKQVNRSIETKERNLQEAGFIKINKQEAEDCK